MQNDPGILPMKDTAEQPANQEAQRETPQAPQKQTGILEAEVLKRPWLVLLAALVVAVAVDLVGYKQEAGTQWAIFVNLILLAVLFLAVIEKKRVPWQSFILILLTSLASLLTLFRMDGYTLFTLVSSSLLGLVLLASSLLNGQWMGYRLREMVLQSLLLIPSVFIGLPRSLVGAEKDPTKSASGKKRGLAVLKGVLIALPFLLIFGALFAAADTVFSEKIRSLFSWLRITNFNDLFTQLFLIMGLTYILTGLFWHGLTVSKARLTLEPDEPLVKPFLGLTESAVVLLLLNLLFAAFLVIQFSYFFAGSAAIKADGFTYAEYARRGFFELVMVALIAGGVHWLFSSITRREDGKRRLVFSVLATLLLAQVGVVLVSAFQRLSLYEAAYGFTQDRLVAHVFMIFLGVILALFALMEITGSYKRLALVLVVSLFAFGLALTFVNPDRTIALKNIQQAASGGKFDPGYLVQEVSDGAVPVLFEQYEAGTLKGIEQEQLGKLIACRAALFEEKQAGLTSWVAWSFPRVRAASLYMQHMEVYALYLKNIQTMGNKVWFGDVMYLCSRNVQD